MYIRAKGSSNRKKTTGRWNKVIKINMKNAMKSWSFNADFSPLKMNNNNIIKLWAKNQWLLNKNPQTFIAICLSVPFVSVGIEKWSIEKIYRYPPWNLCFDEIVSKFIGATQHVFYYTIFAWINKKKLQFSVTFFPLSSNFIHLQYYLK